MEESVQGSVTVSLGSHETSNSEGRRFASVNTLLINFGDVDLNSSMIHGVEDSVSGRALSWHIEIDKLSLIVLNDDDRYG